MAKHFHYFDDWKAPILECPNCGWRGTFEQGDVEYYQDVMDSSCPACDVFEAPILAIVSYPTHEEAEAILDKLSQLDRESVMRQTSRWERWKKRCLKDATELPELAGDNFELTWDFEKDDEDVFTIIRYGDRELWRELALYEGYKRFIEVLSILKSRYGLRLVDVVPTERSKLYLYGDRLSAPEKVDEAREELRKQLHCIKTRERGQDMEC